MPSPESTKYAVIGKKHQIENDGEEIITGFNLLSKIAVFFKGLVKRK